MMSVTLACVHAESSQRRPIDAGCRETMLGLKPYITPAEQGPQEAPHARLAVSSSGAMKRIRAQTVHSLLENR